MSRPSKFRAFGKLLVSAAIRFNSNDGWAHSSHIALSLLLAIFPFCIFSLTLAGQLSTELDIENLVEFVFGTWPDQLSEPIKREIAAVLEQSGKTKLTFSALLAIFFASNGVDAVRGAITEAYRESDPRPFWKTRLLCVAVVVLSALVLSLAGALSVAVPIYFQFVETAAPGFYAAFFTSGDMRVLATVALLLFLVIACHLWLPARPRTLRSVLPGVVVTMVLWTIFAQGFSIYIAAFSTYSVTYAGLAGIMTTIVFMYLMAVLFIYGAEVNAQLDRHPQGV